LRITIVHDFHVSNDSKHDVLEGEQGD
jgi:hypothetical protein